MTGTKYENKRNGQIIEVVSEVDAKTKTVLIRNVETGKEQNVTTATIKRWYKKLEDQEPAEAQEMTEDAPVVADQEPAEEAPAEEVKTEKKERKPRQKKEMTEDAKALHEYVLKTCEDLGGIVFVPAKDMKFRGLKAGKHMFVKYSWGNGAIVLQVRATALGLSEPKHPCNHTFNDKYKFTEDTPEVRAEIFDIMKKAYDWQVCKNLAQEEKKTKKEKKTEE